ncbi:hypothetical protein [Rhizobium lusitanum]|uniref:hypothetical protein n=1 Tax=Rhizobium lusitanum TaxID=293958 RepID=UPI003CC9D3A2
MFDTGCVLCSAWVGLILEHERDQAFLFVSAWSEAGATLANVHGLKSAETYLVTEGGRGLTHSDRRRRPDDQPTAWHGCYGRN